LFSLEYIFISASTSIGTKKWRIYIKGATFTRAAQTFRGEVAQNCPHQYPPLYLNLFFVIGFGTGLVNFSTSSGINYYFKDDRAFAEGVLGSGVCVGIFVFSGLLQMFGHYYTWKV